MCGSNVNNKGIYSNYLPMGVIFSNFSMHQNHLHSLLKHRFLGPGSRDHDLEGLTWDLRFCISREYLGSVGVGLWATLNRFRVWKEFPQYLISVLVTCWPFRADNPNCLSSSRLTVQWERPDFDSHVY